MNRSTFRTRRFAGLEKLESREMFAGVLDYNSSTKVLTVRGEGFNDQATVRYEGSRVTVDLFTQRSNGSVDHKDRTLDISRVVRIQFEGLNGNDRMSVSQGAINPGVNLAATSLVFSGGNGDDTFVNNSGVRSTANGGSGNDVFKKKWVRSFPFIGTITLEQENVTDATAGDDVRSTFV